MNRPGDDMERGSDDEEGAGEALPGPGAGLPAVVVETVSRAKASYEVWLEARDAGY